MAHRHRELVKAGDLFAKYRNVLKAPQGSVIDAAVEVIFDVTGITITKDKCRYTVTTRTLATGAPAIVVHEVRRHEAEIIDHLKGRLGVESAPVRII